MCVLHALIANNVPQKLSNAAMTTFVHKTEYQSAMNMNTLS